MFEPTTLEEAQYEAAREEYRLNYDNMQQFFNEGGPMRSKRQWNYIKVPPAIDPKYKETENATKES